MKYTGKFCLLLVLLLVTGYGTGQPFKNKAYGVIKSERADGRFYSSRGVVHAMLKNNRPRYAFDPGFTPGEFKKWQKEMRQAMAGLMKHPQLRNLPAPQLLSTVRRDGYRVEKWEAYPLPECVTSFLVMVPDGVTDANPAPGILCIPGSGETKETSAGEPELCPKFASRDPQERWIMGIPYVKKGLVAVVVDNPAAGEASDLEKYTVAPNYNYDAVARYLLELDWSYLGYSSYIDMHVLDWMKKQPFILADRLIVSGFSLGTEPLMVMGVLDPSIYAFVYNDFLCRTLERMVVLTEPDENGIRPFPNSIRHLIPGFLKNFDFPDIVASLAPRPVICPEGGLDRDLDLVRRAYEIAGKPENISIYHYPKFADRPRGNYEKLPEGLNRALYFELTNVDPPRHDIKVKLILPWLDKVLK